MEMLTPFRWAIKGLDVNISHRLNHVALCLLPFEPFLHELANLIQFPLLMGNETLKKREKCFSNHHVSRLAQTKCNVAI